MDILKVFNKSGLGHIRNVMGSDHCCQILTILYLTIGVASDGGGGGIRIHGCGGRPLDTGIHITLIVVANVYHIMVSLHGTRQGLETDIISTTVSSKGDELAVCLHFSFFLQSTIGCLDAGAGGTCILEGVMDEGILP